MADKNLFEKLDKIYEAEQPQEMSMERHDAVSRCIDLGKLFIEHFDKIYKEPTSNPVNHWIQEMQNWFNSITKITLKPYTRKLDRTKINDWFLTAGSSPEEYFDTEHEIESYDTFCNYLLISNSVHDALTQTKLIK